MSLDNKINLGRDDGKRGFVTEFCYLKASSRTAEIKCVLK